MSINDVEEGLIKKNFSLFIRKYGVLIALAVMFALFSAIEPAYYSVENILIIIRQASILNSTKCRESLPRPIIFT